MNRLRHLWIFLLLLPLTSCKESYISAHTDYVSRENLASYIIKTPDPLLNHPPVGERLIIEWSVPKSYLKCEDLHLIITIRLRDLTQFELNLPLNARKGTYVYPIMNEDYYRTRGVLTFKVDLIGNGCVLEEWRHQIWTELILIQNTQQEAVEEAPPAYEEPEDSIPDFYEDFE